jgi:hypothetical protein
MNTQVENNLQKRELESSARHKSDQLTSVKKVVLLCGYFVLCMY